MHAVPSTGLQRIRGFDGLRALAATGVFLSHAWARAEFPDVSVSMAGIALVFSNLLSLGTSGVVLFFVLSGFLLSLPFWRWLQGGEQPDTWQYLRRRIWRIYPAYMVAVILFALFYDVAHPLSVRLVHAITHLLLIHNLAEVTIYNISAPLWSVATEFQLYLLLPVLFWILRRLLRRNSLLDLRLIAIGVFVCSLIVGIGFYLGMPVILELVPIDARLIDSDGKVILHSPLVGVMYFAAGIAAAYFSAVAIESGAASRNRRRDAVVVASGVAALLLLVVIDSRFYQLPTSLRLAIMACVYAGIVYVVATGEHVWGVVDLLDARPIRLLGVVSYSFYLYHDYALWIIFDSVPSAGYDIPYGYPMKTLLAFALSLAFAILSYTAIERPFIVLGQKLKRVTPESTAGTSMSPTSPR